MAGSFWLAGTSFWMAGTSFWMTICNLRDREGKMINSWSIRSLNYKTRRCDRIMIER